MDTPLTGKKMCFLKGQGPSRSVLRHVGVCQQKVGFCLLSILTPSPPTKAGSTIFPEFCDCPPSVLPSPPTASSDLSFHKSVPLGLPPLSPTPGTTLGPALSSPAPSAFRPLPQAAH